MPWHVRPFKDYWTKTRQKYSDRATIVCPHLAAHELAENEMDSARSQIIEDLKRHLPAPVRRALGTARRTLAETTERIAFELSPDVVARSPALDAEISRFMSENDVPASLNVDVSKYDLMYQYWGRAGRDTQYMNYLRSGFKHASLIGRLIEYKFQSGERIESILDFASGYGRVARFLVQMMAPHRVFVADIKADAVAFQKKHLGVNGFVSPEKPHDLSISQRFDVIAVFSLFSHLPEETFNAWLEKLIGLLKPAGVLLFTTHGIEHMPAHLKKDTQS
ncbi:MAG TPA: class I SAM-dependent methyltransferase, partial [Candidatus Obscuribacterales bacterium]